MCCLHIVYIIGTYIVCIYATSPHTKLIIFEFDNNIMRLYYLLKILIRIISIYHTTLIRLRILRRNKRRKNKRML